MHGIRRAIAAFAGAAALTIAMGLPQTANAAVLTVGDPSEIAVTPEPIYGGRATAIAIDPSNSQHVFVGTESGGLWERTSSTGKWFKPPFFNEFKIVDVKFSPANPAQIIVTTDDDERTKTFSVAWVSNDHGHTWAAPLTVLSHRIGAQACGVDRVIGGKIAFNGGTGYIATSCGLFISDSTGTTWSLTHVGNFNHVAVATNGTIAMCGKDGNMERRDIHGTWLARAPIVPSFVGCSIAIAPYDARVFVMTGFLTVVVNPTTGATDTKSALFESDDTGATWTNITPPGMGKQNRAPFVLMTHDLDGVGSHAALYWSDGFGIYRQRCFFNQSGMDCNIAATPETGGQCTDVFTAPTPPYAFGKDDDGDGVVNDGCPKVGNGAEDSDGGKCKGGGDEDHDGAPNDGCPAVLRIDTAVHVDPSDIGFDARNCPIWLASDGGMAHSFDCGTTYADTNAGLHALEVYDVSGTTQYSSASAATPSHQDLYIGTQDNGAYATTSGTTWARAIDNDVPVITANPVSIDGQAQVAYTSCVGCNSFFAKRGAKQGHPLPRPPGWNEELPVRWGDVGRQRVGADTYVTWGRGADDAHWGLYVMGPEPASQCHDKVDNDRDGIINDGCVQKGLFAESGTQCHDAFDNDFDGWVNDGCSDLTSTESGWECGAGSQIDDDHDGVINDGCPVVDNPESTATSDNCKPTPGEDEEEDAGPVICDKDAEHAEQCLDNTDSDGDGVINDGCPQIGVWRLASNAADSPPRVDGKFLFGTQTAINGLSLSVFVAQFEPGGSERITRIDNVLGATSTAGSMGTAAPTVRAWGFQFRTYGSYAVDPLNANHIVVADADGNVGTTFNGGLTWNYDAFTSLVETQNGEFLPSPTTIAILPSNGGSLVLVGTDRAGLMYSTDGGRHFGHVAGSEAIPFISSIYFDASNTSAYVSSLGRGVWKLPITTQVIG